MVRSIHALILIIILMSHITFLQGLIKIAITTTMSLSTEWLSTMSLVINDNDIDELKK